ncbi:MAG: SDR family oxidoreductase [Pseudomonadota bacterium]
MTLSDSSPTSPVLVLGATGMLGHRIVQRLSKTRKVVGTIRGEALDDAATAALGDVEIIPNVRADDVGGVASAMEAVAPAAVINCIGVIKQLKEAKDAIPSIEINALFPHRVAALAKEHGARMIHFSTDCVFTGSRGNYAQTDVADATDLYGRTKLLGEVAGENCVTIRSSIIGHELRGHKSLVDWFVSQQGQHIKGFANAHYAGLNTHAMAELVETILDQWPDLSGLWHVASDPINKYDLLHLIRHIYGFDVTIARDEDFHCDRRLDATPFRERTGWTPTPWPQMIETMFRDYDAR